MSVDKLGKVIGEAIADKNKMKTELITPGTIVSRFLFKGYTVTLKSVSYKIERKSMGTSFILGHPRNGQIGTYVLGEGSLETYQTVEEVGLIQDITTAGKYEFLRWLNSNPAATTPESANPPIHVALGTDDSEFNIDSIHLVGEKIRKSGTITKSSKSLTYQIELLSTDFVAIGDTLKEIGLVEDASANHVIVRANGGTTINLTLGTSATEPAFNKRTGTLALNEPYVVSGKVCESDGTTGIANTMVYLTNRNTEEIISTMTDEDGKYIIDCSNFQNNYNDGDTLTICSQKLFARYVMSDLATTWDYNYRFTIGIEFFDETTGAVVTDAGLKLFRDWFAGDDPSAPTNVGWGIGSTAVSRADVVLEGERVRNPFISQRRVDNTVIYEAILTTADAVGYTIRKTGIFNAGDVAGTTFTVDLSGPSQEVNLTIT